MSYEMHGSMINFSQDSIIIGGKQTLSQRPLQLAKYLQFII